MRMWGSERGELDPKQGEHLVKRNPTHPAIRRATHPVLCERLEPRRLLASVVGSEFDPDRTPHAFEVTFDSDVGPSLDDGDFVIINLTTGTEAAGGDLWWGLATSPNTMKVGPAAGVMRHPLAGAYLDDGNYELLLRGDGDGIYDDPNDPDGSSLGGHHVASFAFYLGDVDGDSDVDYADAGIVAGNGAAVGDSAVYTEGDFNGDGVRSEIDGELFEERFGSSLPPAPEAVDDLSVGQGTPDSLRLVWSEPEETYDGFRVWRGVDSFDLKLVAELRNDDADPDNDYTYGFKRGGFGSIGPGLAGGIESNRTVNWTNAGLADGTEYFYRVRAFTDASGNGTLLPRKVSGTTVLPAPDILGAVGAGGNLHTIYWTPRSQSHTHFVIEGTSVADPSASDWSIVGEVTTGASAATVDVGAAGDWSFRVRAEHRFDGSVVASAWSGSVASTAAGSVEGVVWNDVNANGVRDTEFIEGDDPDLVLLIDVSGSTQRELTSYIGNFNGDAYPNTVLDAELAAAAALIEAFDDAGLGSTASVSVAIFAGGSVVLQADPFHPDGSQTVGTIGLDRDADGELDVIEVLRGVLAQHFLDPPNHADSTFDPEPEAQWGLNGNTNFQPPLAVATTLRASHPDPTRTANVVFLSDGEPLSPSTDTIHYRDEVEHLKVQDRVNVRAFGAGIESDVYLDKLQAIDAGAVIFETPGEMVTAFGDIGGAGHIFTEPGLDGWTAFVDLNGDGVHQQGEPQTATRYDGTYTLTGVPAGTWNVRLDRPPGWAATAPVGGTHSVMGTAGATSNGVDFGNKSWLTIDLDADSDAADPDDDGNPLDRSPLEDYLEGVPQADGAPVTIHDDVDGDGIPGWADGYNRDGIDGNDDDVSAGAVFAPLVLDLDSPDFAAFSDATIRLEYDAAPVNLDFDSNGDPAEPDGALRLWFKPADAPYRSVAHYVNTEIDYSLAVFGGSAGTPRTLYVEALQPLTAADDAARTVRAYVDWDGPGGPLPGQPLDVDAVRFGTQAVTPDPGAPATPANFAAVGTTSGIELSWDANAEPDLAGYDVSRWDEASQRWEQLHDELITAPLFADQAAPPGVISQYSVVAVLTTSLISAPAFAEAQRPGVGGDIEAAIEFTSEGFEVSWIPIGTQLNEYTYRLTFIDFDGNEPHAIELDAAALQQPLVSFEETYEVGEVVSVRVEALAQDDSGTVVAASPTTTRQAAGSNQQGGSRNSTAGGSTTSPEELVIAFNGMYVPWEGHLGPLGNKWFERMVIDTGRSLRSVVRPTEDLATYDYQDWKMARGDLLRRMDRDKNNELTQSEIDTFELVVSGYSFGGIEAVNFVNLVNRTKVFYYHNGGSTPDGIS